MIRFLASLLISAAATLVLTGVGAGPLVAAVALTGFVSTFAILVSLLVEVQRHDRLE
ncbi:MAG: hypothetical protein U1E15_02465 [Hyphomicrobiales bacterium]